MREINKAGVANWLRDKRIVKVSISDNLTSTEERNSPERFNLSVDAVMESACC